MRWAADQLGHADPSFTLRIYADAIRSDDEDLSFAEFVSGPGRPDTAPKDLGDTDEAAKYLN